MAVSMLVTRRTLVVRFCSRKSPLIDEALGRTPAIMLRHHDRHAIGANDVGLVAHDFSREIGLKVWVEHWEVVDTNEFAFELAIGECHKRLCKFSIDNARQRCRSRHFCSALEITSVVLYLARQRWPPGDAAERRPEGAIMRELRHLRIA
jgi:hypothetical protein